MAAKEKKREIEVQNVPAPSEEAAGGLAETLAGGVLRTGIEAASVGVNLLPAEVKRPVMGIGRRVLRGVAGIVRDAAEALDSAADRL